MSDNFKKKVMYERWIMLCVTWQDRAAERIRNILHEKFGDFYMYTTEVDDNKVSVVVYFQGNEFFRINLSENWDVILRNSVMPIMEKFKKQKLFGAAQEAINEQPKKRVLQIKSFAVPGLGLDSRVNLFLLHLGNGEIPGNPVVKEIKPIGVFEDTAIGKGVLLYTTMIIYEVDTE